MRLTLFGHTHKEDLQVTKSIGDNANIGINFIGGSITSIGVKNPSFNVITFDAEYMIPLNIETYSFDLMASYAEGAEP